MHFCKNPITGSLLVATVSFMLPLGASAQRVIDFGDLSLAPNSHYNGADAAGGFSSGGAWFNNHHNPTWGSWGGWSYSNVDDTETAGWTNQYAAITGSGIGPTGIYAVAYMDTFTPAIPRMNLPSGEWISSIQITNTTYAYLTMVDGDDVFNIPPFGQGDFFYLTITGLDASNASTGSVDFYLADFRAEDETLWTIVTDWVALDLSNDFGMNTRALEFTLTASDPGIPNYFALGEVTVIPEPGTYGLLAGLGLGAVVGLARLRKQKAA